MAGDSFVTKSELDKAFRNFARRVRSMPFEAVLRFYELKDCPSSYIGESGKVAAVKATEDGLEFVSAGVGDMLKAQYDDNDDNIVNAADDADTVDGQHAADFAPASEGVTNGDSHDHQDGDGDPIVEGALSLSDVATGDVSTSKHGFAPRAPNDVTKYLRGDCGWGVPTGINYWAVTKQSAQAVANDFDAFVNVDGLAFALTSGHRYYFKFIVQWQTDDVARGPRWAFTCPAMSIQHYSVHGRQGVIGTGGYYHGDASDLTTVINGPQQGPVINTPYWCEIEGTCQPSADGTLQLTLSTELDGKTITIPNTGLGMLMDLG